nr:hypothetical protein [Burkholderiales bacterium]
MKTFKKILLWLAAIPLALIAAVVVVQTYYALTPVPLSKEAEELNACAQRRARHTRPNRISVLSACIWRRARIGVATLSAA